MTEKPLTAAQLKLLMNLSTQLHELANPATGDALVSRGYADTDLVLSSTRYRSNGTKIQTWKAGYRRTAKGTAFIKELTNHAS